MENVILGRSFNIPLARNYIYPQRPCITQSWEECGLIQNTFTDLFDFFYAAGYDKERGCIVERNRKGVKHISGIRLLDNHSVNLVSSVVLGLFTPKLAYALWPWKKNLEIKRESSSVLIVVLFWFESSKARIFEGDTFPSIQKASCPHTTRCSYMRVNGNHHAHNAISFCSNTPLIESSIVPIFA